MSLPTKITNYNFLTSTSFPLPFFPSPLPLIIFLTFSFCPLFPLFFPFYYPTLLVPPPPSPTVSSVSGVAMSGVGAAVPGVVETPSANFDKSDQVLFKAQDEFLRRLKVRMQ